eukprot:CAMPEP_0194328176 /NCGR_PEP_ID=MMETSP0171-20130528/43795_1 /TAXON_ID=218684 /ORGANISM="Corethron pennatum, Strain L29A3" /LENGTH=149 /DNA_ID=CAMNT_0039088415 /DNA_START=14 /DNA_END=460 /DNA_ORIENTATION=-
METRPTVMETPVQPSPGVSVVPPNYIIGALPPDLLKMTFSALPASNLFIAPVCRHFRDLYMTAVKEKTKTKNTFKYSMATEAIPFRDLYEAAVKVQKKTNETYKYSITTEAALDLYLEEEKKTPSRMMSRRDNGRHYHTSMIGAGCGRT